MKVEIGTSNFTELTVLDDKDNTGILYEYRVRIIESEFLVANVKFQNGPIKESGVNGCHHEDLLAMVIHRLQQFQSGKYSCRENALAITKIEEAMFWLNSRTSDRARRGVEGTSAI